MARHTKEIDQLIETLKLSPHPEGGYYYQVYCSENKVSSPVNGKEKPSMTDIYFLLTGGQISRFHRIIHDEIWHFYLGSPLTLIEINSDTLEKKQIVIGDQKKIHFKHIVQGGNWQSAYSNGDFSLVGCTVAPGFEFEDFSFLSDNDLAFESIINKYPDLHKFM